MDEELGLAPPSRPWRRASALSSGGAGGRGLGHPVGLLDGDTAVQPGAQQRQGERRPRRTDRPQRRQVEGVEPRLAAQQGRAWWGRRRTTSPAARRSPRASRAGRSRAPGRRIRRAAASGSALPLSPPMWNSGASPGRSALVGGEVEAEDLVDAGPRHVVMFNVGRNNARVRAALIEAMELEVPNAIPTRCVTPSRLARGSAASRGRPSGDRQGAFERAPGAEAVEAALKLGRAASAPSPRALRGPRLSRPDARSPLDQRQSGVHRRGSSLCCPGATPFPQERPRGDGARAGT